MKLYFGLDEVEKGWKRYLLRYNLFEYRIEGVTHPARVQTLNRWRVETPRGFAFVVQADPTFIDGLIQLNERGAEKLSDTVKSAWAPTRDRCKALGAKAVLLETPPEFTPSTRARSLMEDLAKSLAYEQKARVLWSPSGLWEPSSTRDFAESLGLACAIDPFIFAQEGHSPTHGDTCFIINERAGARREFDAYDFEEMIEWAQPYDRVFVLLRGRFRSRHGRELEIALQRTDL